MALDALAWVYNGYANIGEELFLKPVSLLMHIWSVAKYSECSVFYIFS